MKSSSLFSPARPPRFWLAGVCLLAVVMLLGACGGGEAPDSPAVPTGTVGTAPSTETASGTVSPAPVFTSAGALLPLDARTSCDLPDFQAEWTRQINAARASARTCGSAPMPATTPLRWDNRLFSAAARHSLDMATNNYFSHTGLDGRSSAQRIADEGYAWTWTGENIAAGQQTVSAVMAGWLASAGHCSNIMRAQYLDVAVACVEQPGSTFGRYWTMVLARP